MEPVKTVFEAKQDKENLGVYDAGKSMVMVFPQVKGSNFTILSDDQSEGPAKAVNVQVCSDTVVMRQGGSHIVVNLEVLAPMLEEIKNRHAEAAEEEETYMLGLHTKLSIKKLAKSA
jgi:hypothetical protein